MAEKVATFSVKLEGNVSDVAKGDAASLEKLRASIESSQSAIKSLSIKQSLLKGSTEEIKKARKDLTDAMNAERASISSTQLALIKQGVSYDELTKKTEKAAEAAQKDNKSRKATLKSFAGSARSAATSILGAFAATGAAIVGAASAFAYFAFEGAAANRVAMQNLEAIEGSTAGAQNLSHHVNDLARRIPLATSEVASLAGGLRKAGFGGQLFVDALDAVGQAEAAVAGHGAKVQEILARGLPTGKFASTDLELKAVGLTFTDLARTMSTRTGEGVAAAERKLREGTQPIETAASDLRNAIATKFGKAIDAKMLNFDVLKTKLHEALLSLTAGINLDPILKVVQKIFGFFNEDTGTGQALKKVVTIIGNELAGSLSKVDWEAWFYTGLIAAVKFATFLYRVKNAIVETDAFKWLVGLQVGAEDGTSGISKMDDALGAVLKTVKALVSGIDALVSSWASFSKNGFISMKEIGEAAGFAGKSVSDGIVNGMLGGKGAASDAGRALANAGQDAFNAANGIQSPSKVFAKAASHIPEGVALGIKQGTPDVDRAVAGMTEGGTPSMDLRASHVGQQKPQGAPVNITINLHAQGATQSSVDAIAEPSFLAKLTQAVEEACKGAGVPIMVGLP